MAAASNDPAMISDYTLTEEAKKTVPKLEVVKRPDAADIFNDLGALRKVSALTVKRKAVLINVPVGKPRNNIYFRTSSDPEMMLKSTVIYDNSGTRKEIYYVTPQMRTHPKLVARLRDVTIKVGCTWPASGVFLWPVPNQTSFKAWKSERTAAGLSETYWTQMVWDEEKADYDVETAENIDKDPIFAEEPFNQLLKIGFSDHIIDNEDHDYVRFLRGILA